jgi:putative NIF3 family GTP cyclohydrolase 1 type 2
MKITVEVSEKDAQVMADEVNELTAYGHKRTAKQVAQEFVQQIIEDRFSTEYFNAEDYVEYPKQ